MTIFNLKNKIFSQNYRKAGGYTLVELLFYISLFVILALSLINSMIIMTKAFRETTIQRELGASGVIMERISREVRKASNATLPSASHLSLNTTDDAGANKTVEFLLSGSNIELIENSIVTGNLNTPNIVVTNLSFSSITTTEGKAIKIFLTIRSSNDLLNRTIDFYNTVVLRGSY